MKKFSTIVLVTVLTLSLLTTCTITSPKSGEEKNSNDENGSISNVENDYERSATNDYTFAESDFDIDEFLENNAEMFSGGMDGNSTGLSGIPGMDDIYGALGIETTPVPFTPERVIGLDPEWPWAVVEIGWNGYGDESTWVRYSDLFDDEEEYYNQPEETPPPATEPEPPPPKEQEDSAYYAEPDRNMPEISNGSKWPAAYLPPGTPVYPDGDLDVDVRPCDVMMWIYNSSRDSLLKYLESLEKAGWSVEGEPEYLVMGGKGLWWFQCQIDGSTVLIEFMYDEWGM